jgi:hypothetical protein
LTYGTSLNSSLNWSVTSAPNSGPIIFSAGVGYSCGQSVNPFYVGFRKILPLNDTIYGWIRLDSNFPGKVIDYGYQKTSSATNVASLSSKILDVIDVYPNPVNDKVSISIDDFSNSNQYRIKLISIEGKELKSVEITHSKTEISLSDLSNGIYFVEIGHGKILARRKLIVIH